MSYVDEDLKRATGLIMGCGPALAGVDVSHLCRALCLEFADVRRRAFEIAAVKVETCPVPADDIPRLQHVLARDAVIAQRIRGLK